MDNTSVPRKLHPFIKGWKELKAKDQPEVKRKICEYFASKNKLAKGDVIGGQAWRNRLRGYTTKVEDLDAIKSIFKEHNVTQPFGEA